MQPSKGLHNQVVKIVVPSYCSYSPMECHKICRKSLKIWSKMVTRFWLICYFFYIICTLLGAGFPGGGAGGLPLYPPAGAPFPGGYPSAAAGFPPSPNQAAPLPPPPNQAAPLPPSGPSAPFSYNIPARPSSPNDNVESKEDLNIRYR